MKHKLNAAYWEKRYQEQSTPWDLGKVSDPLKQYINQLNKKNLRILLPGAGFGYEALYLVSCGFTNITVVDFAESALQPLQKYTDSIKLIHEDFFHHHGSYDLILEQTFFCALEPNQRSDYVTKMSELIAEGGKLVGLLFNREFETNPPYGGNKEIYLKLFETRFKFKIIDKCVNSNAGREELFFICQKRQFDKLETHFFE